MTGQMPGWVYEEFHLHAGQCIYCQRHYKSAANWAAHISAQHQAIWKQLLKAAT